MKWLPKKEQHEILLYTTLLTKMAEGAHKTVVKNVKMESIVYEVSRRNPEAVRIFTEMPPAVIMRIFDALTDPERIKVCYKIC